MADYMAVHRTNYFKVNDEEKWKEWFSCLSGTQDFTRTDEDGTVWHAFGDYACCPWFEKRDEETGEDFDSDMFCDDSVKMLQNMLPDDQAFVYTECGHKKLRYVCGFATVVTSKHVMCVDLMDAAMAKTEKLLKDQMGDGYEFDWQEFRGNMSY